MTPEQRKHFEFVRDEMHGEPKQEQGEPVAFKDNNGNIKMIVDASAPMVIDYSQQPPPQRTWVGLSVFEINDLVENTEYEDYRDLVERTETKLKERNQ